MKEKQPKPISVIIHRLRLMAESGGNITRDRKQIILDAATYLEALQHQEDDGK